MTNAQAKAMIREAEANRQGANTTRWYTSVHAKADGEAIIKSWAVKTWNGKPLIRLASKFDTANARGRVSGRCLVHNFMYYRSFNWLDFGGKHHIVVWEDIDTGRNNFYPSYPHEFGAGTEFYGMGVWLNGLEETRYKWAGYNGQIRVSDFVDLYHISPKVEYLLKANLTRWLKPSFVRTLASDRNIASFIGANAKALECVPPSIVIRNIRKGQGLNRIIEEAKEHEAKGELKYVGIDGEVVKTFAAHEIMDWAKENKVSLYTLKHHIDNIRELGMDETYKPHIMPKDWEVYYLEIEERVDAQRARKRKENERRIKEAQMIIEYARREIRALVDRWVDEGILKPKYAIVIPRTQKQMQDEGRAMSNCVGTYWEAHATGKTTIAFIRKDGKPYIDLEMHKGEIKQMFKAHNSDVTDEEDIQLCRHLTKACAEVA